MNDIENADDISPDLKEKIFQFSEGLVELPSRINELHKEIINLLSLLTKKDVRTPVNCLAMYKYFPFDKYQRWGLPDSFKLIINKMSTQFHNGKIPSQDAIDALLQEAKSAIN